MTTLIPVAVSPLRQRLRDEMDIRRFGRETQRNYIRDVGRFATFLGHVADRQVASGALAGVGVLGVAYLVTTDGGWGALAMFAGIGWLALR